jgi:hypothetical protein
VSVTSRRNHVLAFIQAGLQDISVSRPSARSRSSATRSSSPPEVGELVDAGPWASGLRHTAHVRIATWNLEGKWTPRHRLFLISLRADVLLLTEVLDGVQISGMAMHRTRGEMRPGLRWAAVAAEIPLRGLPDPHGATALAEIDGLRVASSVLPWRTSGGAQPWSGQDTGARTVAAVAATEAARPVVGGGDWNHELAGPLHAGSASGRTRILAALDALGLETPTKRSPHRLPGATSIDHIAVPAFWTIATVERVSAIVDRVELSDHDAYVVDTR